MELAHKRISSLEKQLEIARGFLGRISKNDGQSGDKTIHVSILRLMMLAKEALAEMKESKQ